MSPELNDFLSGLAIDPDRLARYAADPSAAMAAAHLPEADREVLRGTDFADLGDLTPKMDTPPPPPPTPKPPTPPPPPPPQSP